METVGDISGAIQQLNNLSDVRLEDCCEEITRGVVEGLWRKQTPQHQVPSSQGKSVRCSLVHLIVLGICSCVLWCSVAMITSGCPCLLLVTRLFQNLCCGYTEMVFL